MYSFGNHCKPSDYHLYVHPLICTGEAAKPPEFGNPAFRAPKAPKFLGNILLLAKFPLICTIPSACTELPLICTYIYVEIYCTAIGISGKHFRPSLLPGQNVHLSRKNTRLYDRLHDVVVALARLCSQRAFRQPVAESDSPRHAFARRRIWPHLFYHFWTFQPISFFWFFLSLKSSPFFSATKNPHPLNPHPFLPK